MEKHIRLLDCTLRDGGHIVQGIFGEDVIRGIIEHLVEAGTDIIEIGFLWNSVNDSDTARYYSIKDVKRILPENRGRSKFSLMADYIDLDNLEPCDGTVEFIRLSFKRWRLEWGLNTARTLMDKGYKVFINPVNNNVYTDKQYLDVLEQVNELHPYGFSIVDTFGVMRKKDLSHRYYLVENNLLPDITIGIHLHENLGLAYSLAQHVVEIANPKRNIVIDGSLFGMGRTPGNLCIEHIMDYMNEQYAAGYSLEPVYDAIDDYITPIREKEMWGYATPYALSAKYYLHRTYAEYLIGKRRLKTKDIQRILSQVDKKEAETFNEQYIEKLYLDYMDVKYDDTKDMEEFRNLIGDYSKLLILAPGSSLKSKPQTVVDYIDSNTCVFSVNFAPEWLKVHPSFVFLTNMKRYDVVKNRKNKSKLIITSNLLRDVEDYDYVFAYNELAFFKDEYSDDSTLMLLNLLNKIGIKDVAFAGFDGCTDGCMHYYDDRFAGGKPNKPNSKQVSSLLNTVFKDINKTFITPSEYQ